MKVLALRLGVPWGRRASAGWGAVPARTTPVLMPTGVAPRGPGCPRPAPQPPLRSLCLEESEKPPGPARQPSPPGGARPCSDGPRTGGGGRAAVWSGKGAKGKEPGSQDWGLRRPRPVGRAVSRVSPRFVIIGLVLLISEEPLRALSAAPTDLPPGSQPAPGWLPAAPPESRGHQPCVLAWPRRLPEPLDPLPLSPAPPPWGHWGAERGANRAGVPGDSPRQCRAARGGAVPMAPSPAGSEAGQGGWSGGQ